MTVPCVTTLLSERSRKGVNQALVKWVKRGEKWSWAFREGAAISRFFPGGGRREDNKREGQTDKRFVQLLVLGRSPDSTSYLGKKTANAPVVLLLTLCSRRASLPKPLVFPKSLLLMGPRRWGGVF